jgi:hypothetical protein
MSQTGDIIGYEWFVHYKIGDTWMVDGPYSAHHVTDRLDGHKRMAGYQDGYVSDLRRRDEKDHL